MVTINDIHKIQDERNKLFGDFYSNKIPERMPISFSLPNHLIAQYGGIDPFRFQYDFSLLKETAHELCGKIISDSLPVAPAGWTTRTPAFYGILGSKTFVMGNNGYVQHPEVAGMEADEYDELIKDPINFIASTVIPRMYKNLDPANPLKMHKAYETAKAAMSEDTGKTAAYCIRTGHTDMDDVIFLFLEIRDLGVALHQQIQGRGLDTAHGQGLVVQHGEKPGGVDAHQPIRLGPAQGRLIQRVIVRSRFQVGKAVFNGAVLHAGNPKALERLFTACHLVNKTENQFSLAPGVGGAHKAGHVGALHQGAQNVKLLLFLVGDDVLPRFREDGQILIAPFLETLVIPASVSKGHQMPDAPAHQIAVSLQIPVVFLRGPDHARNTAGDTRFFCDN